MILGYLDPGSGSLLLQAVLGGLAGIGVAFKAWRSRLTRRGAPTVPDDSDQPVESTPPTEP